MRTNHRRGFVDYNHRWKGWSGSTARLPAGLGYVMAESNAESSNGHRGMARQVRGAKKFVRNQVRKSAYKHIKEEIGFMEEHEQYEQT